MVCLDLLSTLYSDDKKKNGAESKHLELKNNIINIDFIKSGALKNTYKTATFNS